MIIPYLVILLCAHATAAIGPKNAVSQGARQLASANQIRPALILWNTGLVETITPATLENRKTWRVTHYPQDPTSTKTNDYDLYDLDRDTLAPLRSVMNTDEYHLELSFAKQEATYRKTTKDDVVTERIPLTKAVEAEGPGLDVFVAGLPLATGFQARYGIVDRWGGHGATRFKTVTLSVSKKITENTALGKQDVYEVLIRPDDGSFLIRERVFAQSPHFPVSVEYTRDGKTYPVSEVIALTTSM